MPIKKCRYCTTRMSRVIYGMPSSEDYEARNEFIEYRGCIVMDPSEDWRCGHCDAKIIPGFTPASGVCTYEAPAKLSRALDIFAKRLTSLADFTPSASDKVAEPTISILCGGPSWEHDVDTDPEHDARGDWLEIPVCKLLTLKIFFNGTGQLVDKPYKCSSLMEDVERYEQDFSFPASAVVVKNPDDLITGKDFLIEIAKAILAYQAECSSTDCNHKQNSYWENLEEVYPSLMESNARLHLHYPITQ